jgi:hypothetical protein
LKRLDEKKVAHLLKITGDKTFPASDGFGRSRLINHGPLASFPVTPISKNPIMSKYFMTRKNKNSD